MNYLFIVSAIRSTF